MHKTEYEIWRDELQHKPRPAFDITFMVLQGLSALGFVFFIVVAAVLSGG